MMILRRKKRGFTLLAIAFITTALLWSCKERQSQSKETAVVTDSTTGKKIPNMRLTLPLLDALFYEEGFEKDLTAQLQLSEAQVQKLKTVARQAVEQLSEEGPAGYGYSERTAVRQADEKIRDIIGPEKAQQLYQLVGRRYENGDVAGLMPTMPNAVPTDTRIVVNAPAYRMDVFQNGRLLKTFKVGIGYPEFPLPSGMRRAETIIFNPTWTPPNSPWVTGKFKPGETVAGNHKDNPLGPIKIPIGLPALIHGGKNPAKLGTFASHGCVGLTNEMVQDFAEVLSQIGGSPLSLEAIKKRQGSKTEGYKLANPVPVELRYETIVAENGALRLYRDVYERGTNTVENAKKVLAVYGISFDQLPEPERQQLLAALREMNRDAQGNPIVADAGIPVDSAQAATPDELAEDRKKGVSAAKQPRAKSNKVTRTVAGEKEMIVPIAALQGKGYPAPVHYETGGTGAVAPDNKSTKK